MLFTLVHLNPGAGLHPVQGAVAQLPVVIALCDSEEDVAAGRIGVVLVHQGLDRIDDWRHLLGRHGIDVGPLDVEGVHATEKVVDVPVHQLLGGYAFFLGLLDNLVVHVGEVLNVAHRITQILQVSPQDVEGYIAKGVAHVGGRIGRDAADVHLDALSIGRNKLFNFPGQSVI